jgi:site-specific DNA-cytosine methylase
VCPCQVGLACKNKKLKLKFKNSLLPFSLAHTATKNNGLGNSFQRISTTAVFASITTNVNPMGRQVGLKTLLFNCSNKITSFQGTTLHHTANRLLTPREVARAQAIPDHFQFCGKSTSVYSQVFIFADNLCRILTRTLSDRECCATTTWIPLGPGDCQEHT